MEIRDLKNISISNLILIILNDKNNDILRRCGEVELRKRIKNVGWPYDDLLHFDDKVIKQRGLDVENYLISPNVNMQQLMEIFFTYDWKTNYNTNCLLFSEKHLCNTADFAAPFFHKVCNIEINNISQRLEKAETQSQKEQLLLFKQLLEERNKKSKQNKKEIFKDDSAELLCYNEAMCQLGGPIFSYHEFLQNCSDEELYKLLRTKSGILEANILGFLNDSFFDIDLIQNLCGLNFVRKDSSKLNKQKRQLLHEIRSGYEINYETEGMQKALQKIKKIDNFKHN